MQNKVPCHSLLVGPRQLRKYPTRSWMSANLEVATEALLHANRNWGVPRLTRAPTRAHFRLLFTPCKQSMAESKSTHIHTGLVRHLHRLRVLAAKLDDLSLFDLQDLGGRGSQLPQLRDNKYYSFHITKKKAVSPGSSLPS